jgi:hypothetical protein
MTTFSSSSYMRFSRGPKYLFLHVPTKQQFGPSEHSQLGMIVLPKVADGPAMACRKGLPGEHE